MQIRSISRVNICGPLALPLGELSPQVTERVLRSFGQGGFGEGLLTLSVRASLGRLSQRERQGGLRGTAKQRMIPPFRFPVSCGPLIRAGLSRVDGTA